MGPRIKGNRALPIIDVEIARLRAETPACERFGHFDSAGASLMPDPVFRAVQDHWTLERNCGGYAAAVEAAPALESLYRNLAALLGAEPGEIAYAESATRAWDLAFYAVALAPGDRVLTHISEYGSNYLSLLQRARRDGIEIDLVPSDAFGQVDLDALEAAIVPRTRLIAITHAPMHEGLIQPVAEIGRIARAHGLIFMLDSCQAVGQIDVKVADIGCHILTGTGRKYLRGPRGTGFLYVSSELSNELDPLSIDMRSAAWTGRDSFEFAPGARRFEAFESNIAGRVGLAAAAAYALEIGPPRTESRIKDLVESLRGLLGETAGVQVRDRGRNPSGIVTFTKSGVAAEELRNRLRAARIVVSVVRREQALLDFSERGVDEVVRASPHVFNTEGEIARFVDIVSRA